VPVRNYGLGVATSAEISSFFGIGRTNHLQTPTTFRLEHGVEIAVKIKTKYGVAQQNMRVIQQQYCWCRRHCLILFNQKVE
jgi:hypothetical protein